MAARSLHIAWLGPAPGEDGGVPGVAADLLEGLTALGHRIDCFFPSAGHELPARLRDRAGMEVNWGTSQWRWDRWYSRTWLGAFVSGMVVRGIASVRLRRQIARRHRTDPYDLIYQFSTIESLAVPTRLSRSVPLVVHPETHSAGELRWLLAERALSLRCQPRHRFAAIAAILAVRSLAQRRRIGSARLLVCISAVFRDHLVRDYAFPQERTVVVPNPVRLERFSAPSRPVGDPPTVLVLGRIAARKGVQDVVAVARELLARGVRAHVRVVGAPSLWSDYRPLLDDLPGENAEYAGAVPASEVPDELLHADVLLQASRYEPFALTVAEALAEGVPVVATTEVGAVERVDRSVAATSAPGDARALAAAIADTLARLQREPHELRALARAECERLFAPAVVCGQISDALLRLCDERPDRVHDVPAPPVRTA